MSRTASLIVIASLFVATAFAAAPPAQPNDREWGQLSTDYQWIETLRKAQPLPPANASRKQMLELDRKSTRLYSSHPSLSRMPSSA